MRGCQEQLRAGGQGLTEATSGPREAKERQAERGQQVPQKVED